MSNYGIYTRKSDDDRSVTEKSIGEQVFECRKLAAGSQLYVFREWEESKSARIPHLRNDYTQMIEFIEQGVIDGIICWHVNRLVRNMEEGGKLAQLLIDGRIREIRTPSAIYKTGDNIMPLVIEAASATQFSLDHSRVVRRGLEGSFGAGGCTYLAPQGYRNSRNPLNPKKGQIEQDPELFPLLRRAWDLLLTGGYTIRQVADTLNESWGCRTRPTKKKAARPLSYSTLYQIFHNSFYAGYVKHLGESALGKHEPMVTLDEFDRAQQIMSRRSFSAPRKRSYTFTGIMHCAYCGLQVTAETKKLSHGGTWDTYHCSDGKLNCTKRGMSATAVEDEFFAQLQLLNIDEGVLDIAVSNVERALLTELEKVNESNGNQEAALNQSVERLRRLENMWLDGVMVDKVRYQEIEQRELEVKNSLTLEMARIQTESKRMHENLRRSSTFIRKANHEFALSGTERKREVIRCIVDDCLFFGLEKKIEFKIHPLLTELIKFSRSIESIEPPIKGSEKQKEPTFEKSVLFGGSESYRIELPEPLLNALKSELFADLWPHLSC